MCGEVAASIGLSRMPTAMPPKSGEMKDEITAESNNCAEGNDVETRLDDDVESGGDEMGSGPSPKKKKKKKKNRKGSQERGEEAKVFFPTLTKGAVIFNPRDFETAKSVIPHIAVEAGVEWDGEEPPERMKALQSEHEEARVILNYERQAELDDGFLSLCLFLLWWSCILHLV